MDSNNQPPANETNVANHHGRSNGQYTLLNTVFRIIVAVVVLVVGIYVALSPSVVYAPTPRVVLYCLISFLPAILFGAEAVAKFRLQLPGFAFTVIGAAAISLGTLFLLTYLSKPQQQITVFRIVDENRQPVIGLDREGAIDVLLSGEGLQVTKLVDGNNVVLIFPEQVGECEVRVRPLTFGPMYSGKIAYAGNRQTELILGRDLKAN
jgi:hypothetical protein